MRACANECCVSACLRVCVYESEYTCVQGWCVCVCESEYTFVQGCVYVSISMSVCSNGCRRKSLLKEKASGSPSSNPILQNFSI